MADRSYVLLVDDDEDFRSLCRDALEAGGFSVRELGEPDSLIEFLGEHGQPSLVVLDMIMPGRTGWGVLSDLRAHPDHSDLPVLFLTSRDDEDFRAFAQARGAQGYLVKPVTPRDLVNKVLDLTSGR